MGHVLLPPPLPPKGASPREACILAMEDLARQAEAAGNLGAACRAWERVGQMRGWLPAPQPRGPGVLARLVGWLQRVGDRCRR